MLNPIEIKNDLVLLILIHLTGKKKIFNCGDEVTFFSDLNNLLKSNNDK